MHVVSFIEPEIAVFWEKVTFKVEIAQRCENLPPGRESLSTALQSTPSTLRYLRCMYAPFLKRPCMLRQPLATLQPTFSPREVDNLINGFGVPRGGSRNRAGGTTAIDAAIFGHHAIDEQRRLRALRCGKEAPVSEVDRMVRAYPDGAEAGAASRGHAGHVAVAPGKGITVRGSASSSVMVVVVVVVAVVAVVPGRRVPLRVLCFHPHHVLKGGRTKWITVKRENEYVSGVLFRTETGIITLFYADTWPPVRWSCTVVLQLFVKPIGLYEAPVLPFFLGPCFLSEH